MRPFLIVALVLLLAIDLGFAFTVQRYLADSNAKYPSAASATGSNEGPVIAWSRSAVLSVVDFSEKNDKAVVALSTFLIAVFTIVLAFATKRLQELAERQRADMDRSLKITGDTAEAAKMQARASIMANLPVVAWVQAKLVDVPIVEGMPARDPVPPGLPPIASRLVGAIKNAGPTNIVITHLSMKWEITRRLPPKPFYGGMVPVSYVIEAKQTQHITPSEIIDVTKEQMEAIDVGDASLWVYGFAMYDDYLDEWHICRFCYRWDLHRGFVDDGPTGYRIPESQKRYS